MNKIYGIDLGTTNSCLSVLENGRARVVPIDGNGLVPSVVSLDGDNLLVGRRAWNRATAFPEQSVKSVKRLMGSGETVVMGDKSYSPEDISGLILDYLRREARRLEGLTVERAVITVPAYFSDAQRRATIEAGRKAGLAVERIINEPTAAALFYDRIRVVGETDGKDWKNALVYDLGGGTFDVSILRMGEIIEVLASTGDTRLGGDDFDARLTSHLLNLIQEEGGPDLSTHRPALARLAAAAERAKIELSRKGTVHIAEAHIPTPDGSPCAVTMDLTRYGFELMTDDLLDLTFSFVSQALSEAGLRPNDIDRVILVGGMTRLPKVSERLEEVFGQAQRPVVDPDLSVAKGAAVEGGIISGENLDQILVDITTHTLSLEAVSAHSGLLECFPIIPRNTPIPAVRARLFASTSQNQKQVALKVYQGESANPVKNILIGDTFFELAPAEALCPIEVEYSYDLNGLVHLVAEQKGYSRKTEVRFDSRNPKGRGPQALDLLPDQGEEQDDDYEIIPPANMAGMNFVIRRAKSLIEKMPEGEGRKKFSGLLDIYQQALQNEADNLDDIEDELLSLMDEA